MASVWGVAVVVLLPIPLLFLLLLSLPTPKPIKKAIIGVCRNTLAIQSFGVFTLFHFLTFVAGVTFAGQVWGTYEMRQRYEQARAGDLSPCEKSQLLADKWRHERNFWLSALMLTMWIVLSRFYELNIQLTDLQDRLEDAPEPPPAVPDKAKKAS
eukprot:jgi/Ulvmu1/9830/UM056_0071.1